MNKQIQFTNNCFLVTIVCLLVIVVSGMVRAQVKLAAQSTGSESNLILDYQYYDLTCNIDAWQGYFAPDRWQRTAVKATPSAVVRIDPVTTKGQKEPFVVLGQYQEITETWAIEIPAAGYLSFRLLPTGGDEQQALRVFINDRAVAFRPRADGLYYSPFLQSGDRFTLKVPAGNTVYHWTNLLFHTNYKAVIVRPGEADPNRKFVPIEADLIQRIFFLSNAPGTWPVFDQDGDLSSVNDQFELRASDARFTFNYQDQIKEENGRYFLQRTFTIREKCSRGSWMRTERRWVELPIIAE